MTYVVTARKWRPMVFDDVVGQSHITTTLRNAIAANRLSHAYIFSGQRGVGKTTTARILAKAINCLHPQEFNPDNACELCIEITENRSVNVFEIDGASNRGIDEIRNLREAVRYGPAKGKYKVYIIDEVHMLTKEAFNALLKTLEEPPSHILFIFATTEIQKVPLTILSRCQRFDFRRISIEEIITRLRLIAKQEMIEIDSDALLIIAKKSDGSMRDAQSIFDQVLSFCGIKIQEKQIVEMMNLVDEEIYFRTTDIIKSKNAKEGLILIDEIIRRGYDIREFLHGLIEHLRNMLIVNTTSSTNLIETSEIFKHRYSENAGIFSDLDILRLIKIATDTDSSIRWTQQPRLKLEIGLIQMIKLDGSIEIQSLLHQLKELKNKIDIQPASELTVKTEKETGSKVETAIRGSVKASQPTLLPDQIIQAKLYQSIPGPARTEVVTPAQPSGPSRPLPIPPDEAINKWSLLVDEAQKQRIAVGAMLSETQFIDLKDNSLKIGCPDDFHLDLLKRNREFITELAQKIYGAKVHLDTIRYESGGFSAKTLQTKAPGSSAPDLRGENTHNHPIIQALMREFGAEPIE